MGFLFVINEVVKGLPRETQILEAWESLFGTLVHSLVDDPDLREHDSKQMSKVRAVLRVSFFASNVFWQLLQ